MHTQRLTREEQRARTRADLLAAAGTVFARHGYHGTSVDMVAEQAGYTKGAVYSNFDSKEELFLTLFDEHIEQTLRTLDDIVATSPPAERARLLGERRDEMAVFDRDWFLLEAEFVLYAARNEAIRELIASRQRRTRERVARLLRTHLDDLGVAAEHDLEDLALLLSAAGDGLTIAALTQPELDTARLMTLLLELLERGVRHADID